MILMFNLLNIVLLTFFLIFALTFDYGFDVKEN